MIQGASARLGPPVDRPHHLRGPIPAVRAIGVRRRDLRFSAELSKIVEVRSGASAPAWRLCTRFKLTNSLPKGPMPAAHTLTCPEPATLPCRGAHTRRAYHIAAERCPSTSTAATQLQTTSFPPASSKVKALDCREHRHTRSDRATSSAARLGPASSSLPELQEPR